MTRTNGTVVASVLAMAAGAAILLMSTKPGMAPSRRQPEKTRRRRH